jgi:hypothetical protein
MLLDDVLSPAQAAAELHKLLCNNAHGEKGNHAAAVLCQHGCVALDVPLLVQAAAEAALEQYTWFAKKAERAQSQCITWY